MLIGLDESRCERLGDEVKPDELFDAGQHLAVVLGALVDAQHHRRHVAEYRRAHQRYTTSTHRSAFTYTASECTERAAKAGPESATYR